MEWLIRPEPAAFLDAQSACLGDNRGARIGSSALNPQLEVGDDAVGQLALRRHLDVAGVPERLEEEAFLRLAGNDGGAGVATFEGTVTGVEQQTPAQFLLRLGLA